MKVFSYHLIGSSPCFLKKLVTFNEVPVSKKSVNTAIR